METKKLCRVLLCAMTVTTFVHADIDSTLLVDFGPNDFSGQSHRATALDFAKADSQVDPGATVNEKWTADSSPVDAVGLAEVSVLNSLDKFWAVSGVWSNTPILESYCYASSPTNEVTISGFDEIESGQQITLTVYAVGDSASQDMQTLFTTYDGIDSSPQGTTQEGIYVGTSAQFKFTKVDGADDITVHLQNPRTNDMCYINGLSMTSSSVPPPPPVSIASTLVIDFGRHDVSSVDSTSVDFIRADRYVDADAPVNKVDGSVATIGLVGVSVDNSIGLGWSTGGAWDGVPILETYSFSGGDPTSEVVITGFDEILTGQEVTLTVYAVGNGAGQEVATVYIAYNGTDSTVQSTDYDAAYGNTYAQFKFVKVDGIDSVSIHLQNPEGNTYLNGISMTTHLPLLETYENWANQWGVDIGAATNDFDGDLRANLWEYALSGNPTNCANVGFDPTFEKIGDELRYTYIQRNNNTNLSYTVETRESLTSGSWTNSGYSVQGTNTAGFFDEVEGTVSTLEGQRFLRLKIENR